MALFLMRILCVFLTMLALDQLGVPVDAAYMCTSEVDEDGQLVARAKNLI